MNTLNRISQVSVASTMNRQTPNNSFGENLLRSGVQVAQVGSALATGVTSGSPVLSAAISGVTSVMSTSVVPAPQSTVQVPQQKGEAYDLLKLQDQQSRQYLSLQMQMQQESREFNALSNVLKVRHDSAKAAINNVR